MVSQIRVKRLKRIIIENRKADFQQDGWLLSKLDLQGQAQKLVHPRVNGSLRKERVWQRFQQASIPKHTSPTTHAVLLFFLQMGSNTSVKTSVVAPKCPQNTLNSLGSACWGETSCGRGCLRPFGWQAVPSVLQGTWPLKFGKLHPWYIAFHTLWLRIGKNKLFSQRKGRSWGGDCKCAPSPSIISNPSSNHQSRL